VIIAGYPRPANGLVQEFKAIVFQDLTYAVRQLRRTPIFTTVAVATLALGIGGSTAIFTIVDSVLLRPLSFPDPQRLMMLRLTSGSRFSETSLHDWRLESRTFADLAGWEDARANLTGDGPPVDVLADRVTANFFTVLGASPLRGRTFTVRKHLSVVEPEVILSHGFWQRHFGSNPNIIGRTMTLDGESRTIVGVMPEAFTIRTNELPESRAEIWVPFRLVPGDRAGIGGSLDIVGRLAPGATPAQAESEIGGIAQRIEEQYPSYSRDWRVRVVPLHEATVQNVRLRLFVLFGAVGILLLVACANVATLMLNRAATRQSELAIRLSLGATPIRILRQVLTESVVLAIVGGTLGVLLALWGTAIFVSFVPAGLGLPRTREIGIDHRILVFAFCLTVLTGIVFGLVPSVRSGRTEPQRTLQKAIRGSSGGGSGRLEGALIVSEVALALILLAGAGLLGRSFWELSRVDPGFSTESVLTMRTALPASRYQSADRIRAFSSQLFERIQSLPQVRAVGSANYLPLSNFGIGGNFEIAGRPPTRVHEQPGSVISVVGGDYFRALQIPLVRGRFFSAADTKDTQPVFVIDEELARRHWPGEDPIGARITWQRSEGPLSGEIIGIVGSVRWAGMAAHPNATTYWWLPQVPKPDLTIVTRTDGDPSVMSRSVAAQVTLVDPSQSVGEIRSLREFVTEDLTQPRFTMLLLSSFAAAALFLAAIGLYAVIAFGVTQRTREIGVRVALGARYGDVLRLVMRRGALLVGIGLSIGIGGSFALGRLVAGLLYGVAPADPPTLITMALFLTAVAMLANYLPARRAAQVDPMVALRSE
jgi:predicted permease